jgi:hypothetical protein
MTDSVLGLSDIATRCLVVGRQCDRDARARTIYAPLLTLGDSALRIRAALRRVAPVCSKVLDRRNDRESESLARALRVSTRSLASGQRSKTVPRGTP